MPGGRTTAPSPRPPRTLTAVLRGSGKRNKSLSSVRSRSTSRAGRPISDSPLKATLRQLSATTAHFNRSVRSEGEHNPRHHGHYRPPSRLLRDVAVARLQRWIRSIIIGRTIAQRGTLAARIFILLEWQRCLRQVRVRAAKRTLRNAFNALAIARRGGCESTVDQKRVSLITCMEAFLRARHAASIRARLQRSRVRAAVAHLETAWLRCRLFAHLQRLSIEERVHRLLFLQEDVERRDFVRLHMSFLVECHQRCYNDKTLMNAGAPAVRQLLPWEHVVMDPDAVPCASGDDSPVRNAAGLSKRSRQRVYSLNEIARNGAYCTAATEELRWALKAIEKLEAEAKSAAAAAATPPTLSPRSAVDAAGEKYFHNKTERMRLSRSDAAFLQLLQLDCGHIDFPTSMGARPPSFGEVPSGGGSSGGVVLSADAWRLQDRWSAIDALQTRLVWVADVLLRADVREMTLFGEILARLKARRQSRQNHATALLYGAHVDVVNAKFLQPVRHGTGSGSDENVDGGGGGGGGSGDQVLFVEDYTVSAASMGHEWAEMYREMNLRNAGKSVHGLQSLNKTTSSSFVLKASSLWRSSGCFNMSHAGRASMENLIAITSPTRSMCGVPKVSMISTRPMDAGPVIGPRASTTHLGSEFDIRYEIERLLICEYYHRVHIKEDCDVVSTAISYLFRRLQDVVGSNTKEKGDELVIKRTRASVKS